MLIAQISDTHIKPELTRPDGRPTTRELMQRAVEQLIALRSRPDVVLVTGDCTDHGTPEEVAIFHTLLAPLPMPVFVIPGNHDQRATLRARFGAQGTQATTDFMQYVIEDFPVRLIALDTLIPGSDAGELCAARLQWLDDRLREAPATPTLVFQHHPPFDTGLDVLDALGLKGREAQGRVLARHPQVQRVVAGHIHCVMQQRFHGTLAMTAPSTALNIAIERATPTKLWASLEPAGILLHHWSTRAGLVSHLMPIPSPALGPLIHDGVDWRL